MRLKSTFIKQYKNLKNFKVNLDDATELSLFVGTNGSGKSNFFEALIELFRHLIESQQKLDDIAFEYNVEYEINDQLFKINYANSEFNINGKKRKTTKGVPLPDNLLMYYSGQNNTVSSLIEKYKKSFKSNLKSSTGDDNPAFIGIGPSYKELFLAIYLLLPEETKSKSYIFSKLGIKESEGKVVLRLKRPSFFSAKSIKIEHFDPATHYWGAKGILLDFFKRIEQCIDGEFSHQNIYNTENDIYTLEISIDIFKKEFGEREAIEADGIEEAVDARTAIDASTLFRLFDNLNIVEMLSSINAKVTLQDDTECNISHFSDGQFQSVYIYSLAEIFKDRNCITLLDEPDSFLHPEWQFEFLDQIADISSDAAATNHVLMTSHSAATLTATKSSELNSFEKEKKKTVVKQIAKDIVLKQLSGNRISLNEKDIVMNITNFLRDSNNPVLFTEGITDEYILDIAWDKLYPGESRLFCINNAFDRRFLKNLFKRQDLRDNYKGRYFFGLFDFDDAYDDYNELTREDNTTLVNDNFMTGLTTQLECKEHFVMLLPVLDDPDVIKLVCNSKNELWARGRDSHLSIELLFYREDLLGQYFSKTELPGGGERLEFSGKKVDFAENFVPELDADSFEVFRPMFEFIKQKCAVINDYQAA
ncbi:AAA family ATPase [Vibrio sp. RC27]